MKLSKILVLILLGIFVVNILATPASALWNLGKDADRDGASDELEEYCGTDPNDGASKPAKDDPCRKAFETAKISKYSDEGGPYLGVAIGMIGETFGMDGLDVFGAILLAIIAAVIVYDVASSLGGGGLGGTSKVVPGVLAAVAGIFAWFAAITSGMETFLYLKLIFAFLALAFGAKFIWSIVKGEATGGYHKLSFGGLCAVAIGFTMSMIKSFQAFSYIVIIIGAILFIIGLIGSVKNWSWGKGGDAGEGKKEAGEAGKEEGLEKGEAKLVAKEAHVAARELRILRALRAVLLEAKKNLLAKPIPRTILAEHNLKSAEKLVKAEFKAIEVDRKLLNKEIHVTKRARELAEQMGHEHKAPALEKKLKLLEAKEIRYERYHAHALTTEAELASEEEDSIHEVREQIREKDYRQAVRIIEGIVKDVDGEIEKAQEKLRAEIREYQGIRAEVATTEEIEEETT